MKIADLFVNIGLTGNENVSKGLNDTKKGLGAVSQMALETKVAILAVIYAFDKMISASINAGQSLKNLSVMTGISEDTLQRWQYAGKLMGASAQEVSSSISSVQKAMTDMAYGKGMPSGLPQLAAISDSFDIERAKKDTMYVMTELSKAAQKVPPQVFKEISNGFGLGDNVIAAMMRGGFNEKTLKDAPILKKGEIAGLDKMKQTWEKLGSEVSNSFDKMVAKFGPELMPTIEKLAGVFLKLADALMTIVSALTLISEKVGIFKLLGGIIDAVGEVGGWANETAKYNFGDDKEKEAARKKLIERQNKITGSVSNAFSFAPKTPAGSGAGSQNINVNQNLNFQHDGKDHKKTSDSVHKAVKGAFYNMKANEQVV